MINNNIAEEIENIKVMLNVLQWFFIWGGITFFVSHLIIITNLPKIRRLLERKAYDIVQEEYTEVGELIEKIPDTPLYDYYNLYKYIINSFNHSSSRIVPPIFVYSFRALQEMYDELLSI